MTPIQKDPEKLPRKIKRTVLCYLIKQTSGVRIAYLILL